MKHILAVVAHMLQKHGS